MQLCKASIVYFNTLFEHLAVVISIMHVFSWHVTVSYHRSLTIVTNKGGGCQNKRICILAYYNTVKC